MRGKSLTPDNSNLSFIFYKIRTTRAGTPLRRSWQRRARIALAKLDWLTPAERHEIACIWSRQDCQRYNSPALRKYMETTHGKPSFIVEAQKPVRPCLRASFTASGQVKPRKTSTCRSLGKPLHLASPGILAPVVNRAVLSFHVHKAIAVYHRESLRPALDGNATPPAWSYGTRWRLHGQTMPMQTQRPPDPQLPLKLYA